MTTSPEEEEREEMMGSTANVTPRSAATGPLPSAPIEPLGKFCDACQAIPSGGYCNLAGCPNAPVKEAKWSPAESAFLDGRRQVQPSPDGGAKPIRIDLAIAALHVALETDDPDTRYGFTRSALDFLTGDYEALDE